MRALCGSIITAGALIGLGLVSMGIGTRYQYWSERDPAPGGNHELLFVKFSQMDSSLIFALIMMVLALLIGLGVTFVGLALHHERRKREHEHHVAITKAGQRVTV